jgi:hypothetical protein
MAGVDDVALSVSWKWFTRPVNVTGDYPNKKESLALFCSDTDLPFNTVIGNRVIQSILSTQAVDDKMLHVALGRCLSHFIRRRNGGSQIRYPGGYLATLIFVYTPELRPLVDKQTKSPPTDTVSASDGAPLRKTHLLPEHPVHHRSPLGSRNPRVAHQWVALP